MAGFLIPFGCAFAAAFTAAGFIAGRQSVKPGAVDALYWAAAMTLCAVAICMEIAA